MAMHMMANGTMIKLKAKVIMNMLTVLNMLASGMKIDSKDMVWRHGLILQSMKETTSMERNTV